MLAYILETICGYPWRHWPVELASVVIIQGASTAVIDQTEADDWFVLLQRSSDEMRVHLQNRIDYVKNVIGPRIGAPYIQPPVGQGS